MRYLLFAGTLLCLACGDDDAPTTGRCGDGVVTADEACDDGNRDDQDDCLSSCQLASCGDGLVWSGRETCDDGNTVAVDSCTSECEPARCGDGYTRQDISEGAPGEEFCDDGNAIDDDGCSNTCLEARCGDGVVRTDLEAGDEGFEACDDGNDDEDDECTTLCAPARCGDGVLSNDETCDDANSEDTDACSSQCEPARCGDGLVWVGNETCDDGNTDERDACTNLCQTARCGDGIARTDVAAGEAGAEACDDGNDQVGDGCRSDCTIERCGDGMLDPDEACDDGNTEPSDACTNTCEVAQCGDGILRADLEPGMQGYELCDDGNEVQTDSCLTSCTLPSCGDGHVRNDLGEGSGASCSDETPCQGDEVCLTGQCRPAGYESCEDDNNNTRDGCVSCQLARCGDGYAQRGVEACDEGLANSDLEPNACRTNCERAHCGDGILDDGETCDEGEANSDEQPDACRTQCVLATCGDSVVDTNESCDDGNASDTDACLGTCDAARCGDGFVREDLAEGDVGYETCDDDNQVDDDFCTNQCLRRQLGLFDGVLTEVPLANLEEWTHCYTQTYDWEGTPVSFVRRNFGDCSGANLMLACRVIDAETLTVAANGPTSSVFTYTGTEDSHEVNGGLWYYQAQHSWGFAPLDQAVSDRAPCETENPGAEDRICLTLGAQNGQNLFVPGGRCGSQDFTQGGGAGHEWMVFYR